MIIYGKNYDELRAFRVRARVPFGVAVYNVDEMEDILDKLLDEFNSRMRGTENQLPNIPMEYMTQLISRQKNKDNTVDVTLIFAPSAHVDQVQVVLLEDPDRVMTIPKAMRRIEVRHLEPIDFSLDATPPRNMIPHRTDFYEPWGFDLSTGNFVFKKVK